MYHIIIDKLFIYLSAREISKNLLKKIKNFLYQVFDYANEICYNEIDFEINQKR